jgi:acyl carrier protein
LLPDGQISFRGRVDNQVKIRGQRVELDEIVNVLNRHRDIESSAEVTEPDGAGDRRLIGYVVLKPGAVLSTANLRESLGVQLPAYMIPAVFARLDTLPLNSNGKVDRLALPKPGPHNALEQVTFRAPQSALEARVAGIIADLFHLECVSLDDDFFALGGHSLLGTQLLLRLREAFGVELSLAHIFEAETVAKLSAVIENQFLSQLSAMSEDE